MQLLHGIEYLHSRCAVHASLKGMGGGCWPAHEVPAVSVMHFTLCKHAGALPLFASFVRSCFDGWPACTLCNQEQAGKQQAAQREIAERAHLYRHMHNAAVSFAEAGMELA